MGCSPSDAETERGGYPRGTASARLGNNCNRVWLFRRGVVATFIIVTGGGGLRYLRSRLICGEKFLWKWTDIYDGLLQAREKIGIQQGNVELRFIRLGNPGCEKTEITTHTMLMSLLNYESWNSRPLWDKIKEVFTSPIKEQL
jgi:hypothetical protein